MDNLEPSPPSAPDNNAEKPPLITENIMGKLRTMRDRRKDYESAVLPPDHPFFPGQAAQVRNYYGLRSDRPSSGSWSVRVEGAMKVKLTTFRDDDGLKYKLEVPNLDNPDEFVPAGEEIEPKVASILAVFDRDIDDTVLAEWNKPRAKKPLLRFLGFKRGDRET